MAPRSERPWRAIAYETDPTGQGIQGRKRAVAGRTAARTEAGLAPFITRHRAAGHAVDWYEVRPFDLEGLNPCDSPDDSP
jgi:hypothetical protein